MEEIRICDHSICLRYTSKMKPIIAVNVEMKKESPISITAAASKRVFNDPELINMHKNYYEGVGFIKIDHIEALGDLYDGKIVKDGDGKILTKNHIMDEIKDFYISEANKNIGPAGYLYGKCTKAKDGNVHCFDGKDLKIVFANWRKVFESIVP